MKKYLYNSFRIQLLVNILWIVLILVISSVYILFSTIRIQNFVSDSFGKQQHLRDLQFSLEEFQTPFLDYISTRSSDALSTVLIYSQNIRSSLPQTKLLPLENNALREKELYALYSSYLDLADEAIEEKRRMDVAAYTARYDEMQYIREFIETEIDILTTQRFASQQEEYSLFISGSRNIQLINLFFIIFVSLFSVFFLIHVIDRLNEPMQNLSSMASQISAGNFEVEDVGMSSINEIDHVVEAFNRMKKDIYTYIEELRWQRNVEQDYMKERVRNMKMEQVMHRMELYTLQAQMNPHFLFNTLNTGIQLAIVEGAERTGEYMDHLARLFRHNLREKNVVVSLRHEIEGLESFFYILGVRFPKNLDLILDCPEDLLDRHQIPASILQPLVENCVVHAFKRTSEKNSIIVRVFEEGYRLNLSVTDNGCGMETKIITQLLSNAGSVSETDEINWGPKVTGLENVIHRIKFFFPDDPDVIKIRSSIAEQSTAEFAASSVTGTEILVSIDTRRDLCIAF